MSWLIGREQSMLGRVGVTKEEREREEGSVIWRIAGHR